MLFVDDDQTKIVKNHLIVQQGMSTDHQTGGTVRDLRQSLPPRTPSHRSGDQRHPRGPMIGS